MDFFLSILINVQQLSRRQFFILFAKILISKSSDDTVKVLFLSLQTNRFLQFQTKKKFVR